MAQNHRVLVLYRQSLFTQGLQRLLERAGDLEVVGVDLDAQDPISSLREINPDVVVIDTDDLCEGGKELFVQLLRETPSVQLVCLTELDGQVNLYRHEQAPVTRGEQLLKLLRSV